MASASSGCRGSDPTRPLSAGFSAFSPSGESMPTGVADELDTAELALLWAARETGLLDALLMEVGTAAEAAARTDVTEHAARVVVEALVDLEFLRRVGDEVEPTNRALGLLATSDVRSIGTLPHALDLFDRYRTLPTVMRMGEPRTKSIDWRRHELGARAAVDESTVRAVVDTVHAAHPDATRALELSGGPGLYARELASREVDVTLLDGPDVVDAVAPSLASSSVRLEAGSVVDLAPDEYDLVYAVDVAWSLSRVEGAMLVSAATEALRGDGVFLLVEPLRNHSTASVETAVRALATGIGECFAEADVAGWCFEAGLDHVEVADVPGTTYQAVAARRGPR